MSATLPQTAILFDASKAMLPLRNAAAWSFRNAPSSDMQIVRDRFSQIANLADAGLMTEAREACADLMFDFQPVIASEAELTGRMTSLLEKCEGWSLLRRMQIAMQGEPAFA